MDYLVEFEVDVPEGSAQAEVEQRDRAEAAAAAELARDGHLLRLWKEPGAPGESRAVGLYRADSDAQLDGLLGALPLYDWMRVTVTPLAPHPNDPEAPIETGTPLPLPHLTRVYRLEAAVGQSLELGDTASGHRRIVPFTGGTFDGSLLGRGTLVPGVSADWQTMLPDGTALGDIRYTLKTEAGHLLDVRSTGASATAAPRCSPAWPGAKRSAPRSTRFAPQPRSRPASHRWTGSTRACSSASAAARPRA